MSELQRPPTAEPLLGRAALLHEVQAALAAPGAAVLLDGPGGVGKSALARAVAAEVGDAVWFDASPVDSPSDLTAVVARALGLPQPEAGLADPGAALAALLAPDRAPLLVADSVDRCGEAGLAVLLGFLAAAPRARLLATSRVRFAGIAAITVPPLSPESSLELFVRSAGRVRPGFALAPEARGAAIDLCSALDGLPLAIELAAARVGLLGPAQLRDRLVERFRLLVRPGRSPGDRHASLHAALAWSWDPLPPRERAALARLTAFCAGFPLEAAERVVGAAPDEPHPLLTLERLLDASLLVMTAPADAPGGARLRLLDTVRAFAAEALPDEARVGARRHAEWVASLEAADENPRPGELAYEAMPEVYAAAERVNAHGWRDLVEAVVVRRAAGWGRFSGSPRVVEVTTAWTMDATLAPALRARLLHSRGMCFARGGRSVEAVDETAAAIEAERCAGGGSGDTPPAIMNLAAITQDPELVAVAVRWSDACATANPSVRPDPMGLVLRATLGALLDEPDTEAQWDAAAARQLDMSPRIRLVYLNNRAMTLLRLERDPSRARQLAELSLEVARSAGVGPSEALARAVRADALGALGDVEEGHAEALRALDVARQGGAVQAVVHALGVLASVASRDPGRHAEALAASEEGERLLSAVSAVGTLAEARRHLVPAWLRLGRPDRARRLLESLAVAGDGGVNLPAYRALHARLAGLLAAADPRKP